MKLINKTCHDDRFLINFSKWCAEQVELDLRPVEKVIFRHDHATNWWGRAYYRFATVDRCATARERKLVVRPVRCWASIFVKPNDPFPIVGSTYRGGPPRDIQNYLEGLVHTTCHEFRHLVQYLQKRFKGRGREAECESCGLFAVREFRRNFHDLLYHWHYA